MGLKFCKCMNCGNIIGFVEDKGVPVSCCGKQMAEMVPGAVDAAREKHVPAVEVQDNVVSVQIGSVEHPMAEEHFIQWIALETKEGMQMKYLQPGMEPKAVFVLTKEDDVVAVYEYCNLHGLWKKEL